MLQEVLKRVEGQLSQGLPFVIYRKPNAKEVQAILQKDDTVYHTHDFSEQGFVIAPFQGDHRPILLPLHEQLTAHSSQEKAPLGKALDINGGSAQEKEGHLRLVKQGIREIANGKFDKVVLSRKLEVRCTKSPLQILMRLLVTYESAFCYLWYHPKVGMWMGATPEILLRTSNQSLTTMSLAGTQTVVEDERPIWGQKELEEQQMVTDYIRETLQGKVSHLKQSEVASIRAGNLWHLRTKITAGYNKNLSEIIQALHPTPAVCGMPLEPARDFILENENYKREFYTGFLGELNLKQEIHRTKSERNQENKSYRAIKTTSELFVNLRCMKFSDTKATLYVGGGITKDSDPAKEWQETVAKSKTMLQVITD